MHVISKKRLTNFGKKHPKAINSLETWYKTITFGNWKNFADLRQTFRSADQVKNFTVFDIGGNKYRLIVYVDYKYQKVFIRDILLHKDYDQNKWKEDAWFK